MRLGRDGLQNHLTQKKNDKRRAFASQILEESGVKDTLATIRLSFKINNI